MSIIGKAEKPLPHNNNTMKKLILARGVLAASLFCCMSLGNTACVNRIDEESEAEIEEGTTYHVLYQNGKGQYQGHKHRL